MIHKVLALALVAVLTLSAQAAYNHITFSLSTPQSADLKAGRDMFILGLAKLRAHGAAMPSMVDGVDYTHLEAVYGLEAGKGQLLKAELESMLGHIEPGDASGLAIQQFANYTN
jgi:hypothetical protein